MFSYNQETADFTYLGFGIAGNTGADGRGTETFDTLYTGEIIDGYTVYAMVHKVGDTSDPSINNLHVVIGHPDWGSEFTGNVVSKKYDTGTQWNSHYFAVEQKNAISFTTLLSKSSGTLLTTSELNEIIGDIIAEIKIADSVYQRNDVSSEFSETLFYEEIDIEYERNLSESIVSDLTDRAITFDSDTVESIVGVLARVVAFTDYNEYLAQLNGVDPVVLDADDINLLLGQQIVDNTTEAAIVQRFVEMDQLPLSASQLNSVVENNSYIELLAFDDGSYLLESGQNIADADASMEVWVSLLDVTETDQLVLMIDGDEINLGSPSQEQLVSGDFIASLADIADYDLNSDNVLDLSIKVIHADGSQTVSDAWEYTYA
ncbi:hypothetical protein [Roseobacter sp. HKCCA2468]|uniref:hypothetical protein n=1 Tax=Roseobacter sp. HKCCA2468 TaxID=3120342 RepID=UPI0030ED75A0